jgi:hypothetical protein
VTRRPYTGIGSRRAPSDVLSLCERLAERLARLGWTLRSGHAPGCDQAFERGAGMAAEVYLPWPGFESGEPIQTPHVLERPDGRAYPAARAHHPHWDLVSRAARDLHARNVHQVLGRDLAGPSRFVVCWTPDGSLDGSGPDSGGTGQALRVAQAHGVPVLNLHRWSHRERAEKLAAAETGA